jgi:hypothetical protein
MVSELLKKHKEKQKRIAKENEEIMDVLKALQLEKLIDQKNAIQNPT